LQVGLPLLQDPSDQEAAAAGLVTFLASHPPFASFCPGAGCHDTTTASMTWEEPKQAAQNQ